MSVVPTSAYALCIKKALATLHNRPKIDIQIEKKKYFEIMVHEGAGLHSSEDLLILSITKRNYKKLSYLN